MIFAFIFLLFRLVLIVDFKDTFYVTHEQTPFLNFKGKRKLEVQSGILGSSPTVVKDLFSAL